MLENDKEEKKKKLRSGLDFAFDVEKRDTSSSYFVVPLCLDFKKIVDRLRI